MSTAARTKKKITHPTQWVYRGKCRNCTRVENWCAKPKGTSADYAEFFRSVRAHYFPAFLSWCDGCNNHAVHDLLGFSAEGD